MKQDREKDSKRPNFVARGVARIALSVRAKLLTAFLGVTCLLVGLTLFGLFSLHQANVRTEAMIQDQERIAFFNDTYISLSNIIAYTLAIYPSLESEVAPKDQGFFRVPTGLVYNRTVDLERDLAVGARRFGQTGMPDEKTIAELRADIQSIKPITLEIRRLGAEMKYREAAEYGIAQAFEPLQAMQREAYTVVQHIEHEMRSRARTTTQAYLTSRQNIVAAALIAIGVALLLGYSISSSLLWPIQRIRVALGRLSKGGFDERVDVPNRDELGELAYHVNQTSQKLGELYEQVEAQKTQLADWNAVLETRVAEQVEEIERTNRLKRYLPAQVATMIVGASDGEDVLRTRRAEITVLFADLRGFTAFATAATPDQVIDVLNTFHGTCGPLVEACGGTLERFLGDGLMVLFGAPVPVENAAQRAVDLAQDMQGRVREAMASYKAGADERGLGLGIGIATGAATMGQIGFENRLDYSAIGPAPNLAARLCEIAKDGQTLISHATAWQVKSEMMPAGPFNLKGVGSSIAAFELITCAEGV